METYAVSERRACQAMQIQRSSYRYRAKRPPVDETHRRVVELSGQYPYWGYRKMYVVVNPNRTPRLSTLLKFNGRQVAQRRMQTA